MIIGRHRQLSGLFESSISEAAELHNIDIFYVLLFFFFFLLYIICFFLLFVFLFFHFFDILLDITRKDIELREVELDV